MKYLNNPISSNLALCTACCCSINSSLGLTGGNPDQKITVLVFRLVLQNFAPSVFFPCILCYPNPFIYPYFPVGVLLLQYVALSISVQGTSYVLVIINWCRVAISNDKSTLCVPLHFFFFLFFLTSVVTCRLCVIFVISTCYRSWLPGCVWVTPGSCCSGGMKMFFQCSYFWVMSSNFGRLRWLGPLVAASVICTSDGMKLEEITCL